MKILEKFFTSESTDTTVHAGEAYILWTQLQAWYDVLELSEVFINYTNDADLKFILKNGTVDIIKTSINKLEDFMDKYKVDFPERPPRDFKTPTDTETMRDEMIYRVLFDISQSALMFHAKAINICTNDTLRSLFMNFMTDQMDTYDNLIKYGKLKGWVHAAPAYIQ